MVRLLAAASVLAAFTLVAASFRATPAHSQTGDPKMLVLRLNDMSAGFEQKAPHYVNNAEATKEDAAHKDYAKLGRINGYEVEYDRNGGLLGILEVDSVASVYKSSEGTSKSLAMIEHTADASKQPKFRRLSVGSGLGNESRMYVTTKKSGKFNVDVYVVAWRSGNILAAVTAAGATGSIDPADVVDLAKKQQRHIEAR